MYCDRWQKKNGKLFGSRSLAERSHISSYWLVERNAFKRTH
jgi:hypothetical protein